MRKDQLEKLQFQGLKTAMGYRNSTLKNVILEEAKMCNLKDEAVYLAESLLAKNMICGRKKIKNKVRDMETDENKDRMRNPRGRGVLISEVRKRIRKNRGIINKKGGFHILKENYWEMIDKIKVEATLEE